MAELRDLGADDQQLFLTAHGGDACAGIVRGRFTGTSTVGYAVLLRRLGGRQLHEMLLVTEPRKDSFGLQVALGDTQTSRPAVIVGFSPGRYAVTGGDRKIQLTWDGIRYEVIEAGAFLIYWNKDRFSRVTVSE